MGLVGFVRFDPFLGLLNMFWSGFGWVWLSFVRFDTFLGLLEHVWSGFGWVWLSMVWLVWVKFC